MEINVTQQDIDLGKRGECSLCPIALSIKREHGKRALVQKLYLGVFKNEKTFTSWILPDAAVNFVLAFDSGLYVRPFKFKLTEKVYG